MNPVDMKIITEKQKDFVQTLQAMAQGELFDAYAEFLAQENEKYNLTALDARQTRLKHFADSLSAAAAGILPQNARVCDIGSGAGFPAVPLKIVRNDLDMTLLDTAEKKTRFLSALAEKLNITDGIKIKHCRAEQEAGANRAFYDAVTARAVAPLNTLLEYALPLLKEGGVFAAYKGANAVEEAERAENAALLTGANNILQPRKPARPRFGSLRKDGRNFRPLSEKKQQPATQAALNQTGAQKAQLHFPQNSPYATNAAGQKNRKLSRRQNFCRSF